MYFCAFGLVGFLPIAFLLCVGLTFAVYEGRWRWWCLLPLPITAAAFVPVFWVTSPAGATLVVILAPTVGFVALACVWSAYTRWARKQRAAAPAAPARSAEPAPEA